jgi:hypothetical protein
MREKPRRILEGYLDEDEAAEEFDKSKQTLRAWRRNSFGHRPLQKLGRGRSITCENDEFKNWKIGRGYFLANFFSQFLQPVCSIYVALWRSTIPVRGLFWLVEPSER